MIRSVLAFCCVFFFICPYLFAQEQILQAEEPKQQINLFPKGNSLDEEILAAEQIVLLEKQKGNANSYISALSALAKLKKQQLEKKLSFSNTKLVTNILILMSLTELQNIEDIHREILNLHKKQINPNELEIANSKIDLIWVLLKRLQYKQPQKNKELVGETETLYKDVFFTYKKVYGANSDATIALMDRINNLYFSAGKMEDFLPFNEEQIRLIEETFGKDNKRLFAPLVRMLKFALLTLDDTRFNEAKSRLEKIDSEKAKFYSGYRFPILSRAETEIKTVIGSPKSVITSGKMPTNVPAPPLPANMSPVYPNANLSSSKSVTTNYVYVDQSELYDFPQQSGITTIGNTKAMVVVVDLSIDEKGLVEKIEINYSADEKIRAKIQKEITKRSEKWRFRPLIIDGKALKYKGFLNVTYYF